MLKVTLKEDLSGNHRLTSLSPEEEVSRYQGMSVQKLKVNKCVNFFKKGHVNTDKIMFSNTHKLETMTEQRRTCMSLLLKQINRIYETRFCNDTLLGWTRNVGGVLFATRRYDIVTNLVYKCFKMLSRDSLRMSCILYLSKDSQYEIAIFFLHFLMFSLIFINMQIRYPNQYYLRRKPNVLPLP